MYVYHKLYLPLMMPLLNVFVQKSAAVKSVVGIEESQFFDKNKEKELQKYPREIGQFMGGLFF